MDVDQNNNMNPGTEPAAETPATPAAEPAAGGSILSGAGVSVGAPDTYDFAPSLPEGMELDTDTANAFGEIAKGMNLTNEQANQIAKFGYEWAGKVGEAYQAEQQRQADANAA